MIGLIRWPGRPRFRPFDPERAPHRPLVSELLREHLLPLQVRLRGPLIDELVTRILHQEQSPDPLVHLDRAAQLVLLCRRMVSVVAELEGEEREAARSFADLSYLYSQTEDQRGRRRLLAEYLRETVRDPRALRRDLAALSRYLGLDALRERSGAEVLRASAGVELALGFLGRAPVAAIAAAGDRAPEVASELCGAGLAELQVQRMSGADGRWQVRLAAAEGLRDLAAALDGHGARLPPAAAESARRVAQSRDDHAWIQAAALEALLTLDRASGQDVLVDRLLTRRGAGERDFLLRKLALMVAIRRLPADAAERLITLAVGGRDPSEHVRMGMAQAAALLGPGPCVRLLPALAGLDPSLPEPSARVRATAYITAREMAEVALAEASADRVLDPAVTAAASLLARALTRDEDPFALTVACEEVAALSGALASRGLAGALERLAPGWLAPLAGVIAGQATPPVAAEAAAAAAEAVERDRDPVRRDLTTALSTAVARVTPGGRGRLALDDLPAALRSAARDPALLARVLADLSRSSFGLSLRKGSRALTFWRGDRFRRRLWRIAHEVRNPIPNKRQAHLHTVGRVYPGELRAHPGRMDEATATQVPGERVTVDSEGSWCRHLPTVDDVLDLPMLGHRPITVASSLGLTIIEPPAARWRRIKNRLAVSWSYRDLAGLRLASLAAVEPRERRRYLETLERDLGVRFTFEPHRREDGGTPLVRGPATGSPVPPGSQQPVPAARARRARRAGQPGQPDEPGPAAAAGATGTALALLPGLGPLRDWLSVHGYYFLSPSENSQTALAYFAAGLATVFMGRAYHKRQQIARNRAQVPLSIGGWGTRGKSGTERLKAGLFDGLGYQVFVKTTGCEAMFIHSSPLGQPVEIFIYRPYDKATIWEQRAMLLLSRRVGSEVFLWECMALNPKYVQLLQHDWMRDDMVTLTNCYPDHEDIQGPAGFDVAQVITQFIPRRSTLVTSESSYLPLFAETCRQRETRMIAVGEREAQLIAQEVLDLFPYSEHPKNIALTSRVAEELGLDRDLAQVTMAEHVVPDLGVLKAYPRVRVRGRFLTFICGNSANERTGFINNWWRMGLDRLDAEAEPERLVVTVVNNRADRIARSEVFARILVRDVACDRHLLIGTNLGGMRGFLNTAVDEYLAEQHIVGADDLSEGAPVALPLERLGRELGNLRVPPAQAHVALARLDIYAAGAGLTVAPAVRPQLTARLEELLAGAEPDGSVSLAEVRRELAGDSALAALLDQALVDAPPPAGGADPDAAWPETLEPATRAEVIEHVLYALARMRVRARLEAALRRLFDGAGADPGGAAAAAAEGIQDRFRRAYRELFLAQIAVVEDPAATGDQVIDRCARLVPPGCDVTLMGTQNIKGTGLDFVYRWLALDRVVSALGELGSPRADRRAAALVALETFEDHGLVDAGWARAVLARESPVPLSPDEDAARERVRGKIEEVYARRRRGLVEHDRPGRVEKLASWAEAWADYLDSVQRTRRATQIADDLVHQRISHGRAALEMRKLVGRMKGGWLIKALRRRRT